MVGHFLSRVIADQIRGIHLVYILECDNQDLLMNASSNISSTAFRSFGIDIVNKQVCNATDFPAVPELCRNIANEIEFATACLL